MDERIKCSQCGKVNRAGAEICKKCAAVLTDGVRMDGLPVEYTSDDLLYLILARQQQQVHYLKQINTVMQVFGALLILGIVIGLCSVLGLADAFF